MTRILSTLLVLLFMTGCGEEKVDVTHSPEATAEAFFQALYNDNNVDYAASLTNEELAGLLHHYRLASQIQKNVLALSLDRVEELSTTQQRVNIFDGSRDKVRIRVGISGYQGGSVVKEERHVLLRRKEDAHWVITELINNPTF